MTRELSVIHAEVGIIIPPEIVLENARTAAKALADVLVNKRKPVIMNGEQYLEYEDWLLLGQFYGVTVKTGDAVPVEVDGVKGAKAHADIIDLKTGMYLGGAEAYCMRDEEHWNTRPKYEWLGEGNARHRVKTSDEVVPWFQLASMAQTRAGAKALRNRLAWVVVLAGYKATPAEEMTGTLASDAVEERRTVDPTEHYCSVHKVNFFKKGRMPGYAHPIEGTKEWCNEPPADIGAKNKPAATPPTVDLAWVKETLEIINWKNLDAVKWINQEFHGGVNDGSKKSLTEWINELEPEQRESFVKHLTELREAAGK